MKYMSGDDLLREGGDKNSISDRSLKNVCPATFHVPTKIFKSTFLVNLSTKFPNSLSIMTLLSK